MAKLIEIVEEAQEEGVICAGDATDIATHLIHCMVALPTAAAMTGSKEFNSRKDVEVHFHRTWHWLFNGLSGNRISALSGQETTS